MFDFTGLIRHKKVILHDTLSNDGKVETTVPCPIILYNHDGSKKKQIGLV